MKLPGRYPKKLYGSMQISTSAGPDINWTCQDHVGSLAPNQCNVQLSLCVNRAGHSTENWQRVQAGVLMTLHGVQLLGTLFRFPVFCFQRFQRLILWIRPNKCNIDINAKTVIIMDERSPSSSTCTLYVPFTLFMRHVMFYFLSLSFSRLCDCPD